MDTAGRKTQFPIKKYPTDLEMAARHNPYTTMFNKVLILLAVALWSFLTATILVLVVRGIQGEYSALQLLVSLFLAIVAYCGATILFYVAFFRLTLHFANKDPDPDDNWAEENGFTDDDIEDLPF
jgi:hypothetical protein